MKVRGGMSGAHDPWPELRSRLADLPPVQPDPGWRAVPALLARLTAAGASLEPDGADGLDYAGPEHLLTEELAAELRRLKPCLLAALGWLPTAPADWPAPWSGMLRDRRAILPEEPPEQAEAAIREQCRDWCWRPPTAPAAASPRLLSAGLPRFLQGGPLPAGPCLACGSPYWWRPVGDQTEWRCARCQPPGTMPREILAMGGGLAGARGAK